ncbi:unnamed protein product [Moneuplotes crassus]|uniref:Uncharacterized protein n=1 Tax=Euplotes crassus TaxID=5936 RepID=A0AAD1UDA6_EUPCR|nr:unnamed protein product [Moneuplotes crassus]
MPHPTCTHYLCPTKPYSFFPHSTSSYCLKHSRSPLKDPLPKLLSPHLGLQSPSELTFLKHAQKVYSTLLKSFKAQKEDQLFWDIYEEVLDEVKEAFEGILNDLREVRDGKKESGSDSLGSYEIVKTDWDRGNEGSLSSKESKDEKEIVYNSQRQEPYFDPKTLFELLSISNSNIRDLSLDNDVACKEESKEEFFDFDKQEIRAFLFQFFNHIECLFTKEECNLDLEFFKIFISIFENTSENSESSSNINHYLKDLTSDKESINKEIQQNLQICQKFDHIFDQNSLTTNKDKFDVSTPCFLKLSHHYCNYLKILPQKPHPLFSHLNPLMLNCVTCAHPQDCDQDPFYYLPELDIQLCFLHRFHKAYSFCTKVTPVYQCGLDQLRKFLNPIWQRCAKDDFYNTYHFKDPMLDFTDSKTFRASSFLFIQNEILHTYSKFPCDLTWAVSNKQFPSLNYYHLASGISRIKKENPDHYDIPPLDSYEQDYRFVDIGLKIEILNYVDQYLKGSEHPNDCDCNDCPTGNPLFINKQEFWMKPEEEPGLLARFESQLCSTQLCKKGFQFNNEKFTLKPGDYSSKNTYKKSISKMNLECSEEEEETKEKQKPQEESKQDSPSESYCDVAESSLKQSDYDKVEEADEPELYESKMSNSEQTDKQEDDISENKIEDSSQSKDSSSFEAFEYNEKRSSEQESSSLTDNSCLDGSDDDFSSLTAKSSDLNSKEKNLFISDENEQSKSKESKEHSSDKEYSKESEQPDKKLEFGKQEIQELIHFAEDKILTKRSNYFKTSGSTCISKYLLNNLRVHKEEVDPDDPFLCQFDLSNPDEFKQFVEMVLPKERTYIMSGENSITLELKKENNYKFLLCIKSRLPDLKLLFLNSFPKEDVYVYNFLYRYFPETAQDFVIYFGTEQEPIDFYFQTVIDQSRRVIRKFDIGFCKLSQSQMIQIFQEFKHVNFLRFYNCELDLESVPAFEDSLQGSKVKTLSLPMMHLRFEMYQLCNLFEGLAQSEDFLPGLDTIDFYNSGISEDQKRELLEPYVTPEKLIQLCSD